MSRAISLEKIRDGMFSGAKDALNSYQKHSGFWLSWAPESYLQACVFRKLGRIGVPYVTLEASPKRIINDSHVKIDKRRVRMRANQRFDVVGWYNNGFPHFILEIKKMPRYTESSIADIRRIRAWLNGSTPAPTAGYFLTYDEAKGPRAETTLMSRLTNLNEKAQASSAWIETASSPDEEGWRWAFSLLEIRS